MKKAVIVVGAGIAGLATAYRLASKGVPVEIFEADDAVGGRMATERNGRFVLDSGADGLLDGYTETQSLIAKLGLTAELAPLKTRTAGVWRDGRVHRAPSSILELPSYSALKMGTKFRSVRLLNALRKPAAFDHLSVDMFARNVGGEELLHYAFDPCVRGLFGWNAERASAGALLRILAAAGGRLRLRTYRSGMDALARELAQQVPVRLRAPVSSVRIKGKGVMVSMDDGSSHWTPGCVLAVPAPVAARLSGAPTHPFLTAASYTTLACLDVFLDRPLATTPGVYGVTFPSIDEPLLAWAAFESAKPNRVPEGRELVRLTTTGRNAEKFDREPDAATAGVLTRAERYFPGLSESASQVRIHRFVYGLPECPPAAQPLRKSFLQRAVSPLEYAGDWLCTPSSEGAVRSSHIATRRMISWMREAHGTAA